MAGVNIDATVSIGPSLCSADLVLSNESRCEKSCLMGISLLPRVYETCFMFVLTKLKFPYFI